MDERILRQTDRYYTEKIKMFGTVSRGVDWNSQESQRVRFDQISKIFPENFFTVCDYGCGYGAYWEYLKERGYQCKYVGMDISDKMIEAAKELYGNETDVQFVRGGEITQEYDYIVSSGIFNVRLGISDDDWKQYMLEVLNNFWQYSKKGFSFNALTKYSDLEYMKEYLYYADPLFFFDYAKANFSRNVALLHDYDLYEWTLLVRKICDGKDA